MGVYGYLIKICDNITELHTSPLLLNFGKDESGFAPKFFNILTKSAIKELTLKYVKWEYVMQLLTSDLIHQIEKLNVQTITMSPLDVKSLLTTHSQSLIDMMVKPKKLDHFS